MEHAGVVQQFLENAEDEQSRKIAKGIFGFLKTALVDEKSVSAVSQFCTSVIGEGRICKEVRSDLEELQGYCSSWMLALSINKSLPPEQQQPITADDVKSGNFIDKLDIKCLFPDHSGVLLTFLCYAMQSKDEILKQTAMRISQKLQNEVRTILAKTDRTPEDVEFLRSAVSFLDSASSTIRLSLKTHTSQSDDILLALMEMLHEFKAKDAGENIPYEDLFTRASSEIESLVKQFKSSKQRIDSMRKIVSPDERKNYHECYNRAMSLFFQAQTKLCRLRAARALHNRKAADPYPNDYARLQNSLSSLDTLQKF
ncbi:MAG: hypothetical protein LBC42_01135 [Puniceicoccales bacterium]|jgi:hypothetical protein|nr:hypothetical protein [Puniceicoccales bacterium]